MKLFKVSDFEVVKDYGGNKVNIKGRLDTVHIYDYKLVSELISCLVNGVLPKNRFLQKCARNMLSSDEFNSLGQGKSKQFYNNRPMKKKHV